MSSFFALNISSQFPPAARFYSLSQFVNLIIPTLIIGAGVILMIMIVFAGFSILQSGGNPEALKKTQKLLTASIVGFSIIIASYIIVRLSNVVLNLKLPFF